MEKQISDTKKTLRSHQFLQKYKLRKYLYGVLYIDIYEADI